MIFRQQFKRKYHIRVKVLPRLLPRELSRNHEPTRGSYQRRMFSFLRLKAN